LKAKIELIYERFFTLVSRQGHFSCKFIMSFGNIIFYTDIVKEKMEGVLGNIEVELDGRFRSIRTQETNLGKLNCWLG
jgi:hypothetical protein